MEKNLMNLTNCELFAKIVFPCIHRYTGKLFGICTNVKLICQNFLYQQLLLNVWFAKSSAAKIFPCTVTGLPPTKLVHLYYTNC